MGGLHILFNFMTAIGQHMENAGLDNVWVESGAFAQNSTSAMKEDKAYYRALWGHIKHFVGSNGNYFSYGLEKDHHCKTLMMH